MYAGGRLSPWFDRSPNHAFVRNLADKGGKRMTQLVKMNTPIDTGNLREHIKQKPLVETIDALGQITARSGAETFVEYAPYVEHGTGLWGPLHAKYVIRPKDPLGWLHFFTKSGDEVFTKIVWHPGSPGNHMFALGAAIVEFELHSLAEPLLFEWKIRVEQQNKSGLGASRL